MLVRAAKRDSDLFKGPIIFGGLLLLTSLFFIAALTSCATTSYRVYSPADDSFTPLGRPLAEEPDAAPPLGPLPASWEVRSSAIADVTGDGTDELVLLVRRPWRDWETTRWHGGKSPIADFHDSEMMSSHVIVKAFDGETIWAGSALPHPMVALDCGDVDGDGTAEVVTLEGEYADGPDGPGYRVDVWEWDAFGFSLVHRSPPGVFRELTLRDIDGDGIVDIIVR
jgi:hypothetical protein